MSHDYMLPVSALHEKFGIPVIFYDQIGSGRSTHLPEKKGDGNFWTTDLFCNELLNLLQNLGVSKYHILGQSWGGMLASILASRHPAGLQKLIVSNSPASIATWIQACDTLREALPQGVQNTLKRHEDAGTTDSQEYEAAVNVFYERHLCRVVPFPEPLVATLEWLKKDPTVYHTMNGPSEFHVTGTLRDFSAVEQARNIKASTLLINGRYDEAQDICVEPFFRNIDKVKWLTLENSSHLPMLEETERYIELIGGFLQL